VQRDAAVEPRLHAIIGKRVSHADSRPPSRRCATERQQRLRDAHAFDIRVSNAESAGNASAPSISAFPALRLAHFPRIASAAAARAPSRCPRDRTARIEAIAGEPPPRAIERQPNTSSAVRVRPI